MIELDEPAHIRIKIGDSFVHLPSDKALAILTSRLNGHRAACEELQRRYSEISTEAELLKATLYTKFRGAINLER